MAQIKTIKTCEIFCLIHSFDDVIKLLSFYAFSMATHVIIFPFFQMRKMFSCCSDVILKYINKIPSFQVIYEELSTHLLSPLTITFCSSNITSNISMHNFCQQLVLTSNVFRFPNISTLKNTASATKMYTDWSDI